VEVTFKNAVEAKDVKAANFSIEGLTVSNAAVKQTDSKTVVLTTSAQEGGKQYTVKSGSATLGKFIGASAVVPTAIKVTTPSVQGTIGKEVTLKAEVTVEAGKSKAGIPVTFNIVSDNSNLNNKIEVEALTDENGVASYSYTRYYKHNDNVTAYATQKSQVYSSGKVYWAEGLSLTEVTEGNTLANGSKKVYKIKTDAYQVQKDASGKEEYKYVNVAFAENVDVTPDKLVRGVKVIDTGLSTNSEYPSQVTTGGVNKVRVKINDKGEGTFTLTGSNASVTPIVFVHTNKDEKLTATDLQAKAATVKFDLSHTLGLDVKAEGSQNAASISTEDKGKGGREYTVTVTDKEGKVAPKGTVAYVTFQKDSLSKDKKVYVDGSLAEVGKTYAIKVTNDKGQASFVLTGEKDAYATPTVFLNNGTSKEVALDDNDLQKVGEITYFVNAVVENATLTITDKDGNEVTSVVNGEAAKFTYQSVDQNGFDYYAGTGSYEVTFQVTAQFGDVTVTTDGGSVIGTVKKGTTESFKVTASKGTAVIKVKSDVDSTIGVQASASLVSLPNVSKSVSVVTPTINVFSGKVIAHNPAKKDIYLQDKNSKVEKFNYSGADLYDSSNKPLTVEEFVDGLGQNAEVTYKKVGDKSQFHLTTRGSGTLPTTPPTAPVNHEPVAKAVGNQVVASNGTALTFTASQLATDEDGDALTIVSAYSSDASVATVAGAPGTSITVTPAGVGSTTVNAVVSDSKGGFANVKFTVDVTDALYVQALNNGTPGVPYSAGQATVASIDLAATGKVSTAGALVVKAGTVTLNVNLSANDDLEAIATKINNEAKLVGADVVAKATTTGINLKTDAKGSTASLSVEGDGTLEINGTAVSTTPVTGTGSNAVATPAQYSFKVLNAITASSGVKVTVKIGSETVVLTEGTDFTGAATASATASAIAAALDTALDTTTTTYTVTSNGDAVILTQDTPAATTGVLLSVSTK
ncbi:hypothetical protein BWZ43_14175, partial [Heyndrickxia oleronia]